MSFNSLGLSDTVLKGIRAMGYEDPTPIQLRGIPLFLEGRDLIGSAQTGTGKTAAFGLPILTKLDKPADTPRALIVEPTRELASQVETHQPYGGVVPELAARDHLALLGLYGHLRAPASVVAAAAARLRSDLAQLDPSYAS